MKPELTKRQSQILEFTRNFISRKGYPPSMRDITSGCQISSTSVTDYNLNKLADKGYIHRDEGVSRGIFLTDKNDAKSAPVTISVPILETFAAIGEARGAALPSSTPIPQISDWMAKGRTNPVSVRVTDDSMTDALIAKGDLVVVEATEDVEEDETAVVWLRHLRRATIGRIRRTRDKMFVTPQARQPSSYPIDATQVKGRVVCVLRIL